MTIDKRVHSEVARLASRGLLPRDAPVEVAPLSGGVSAEVSMVAAGDRRLVVKLALPRLRVTQEWEAPPDRVLVEADALRCAAAIRPAHVPAVVDVDEEALVIVLQAAPRGWVPWKSELLAGHVDVFVAEQLARALAAWHSESSGDGRLLRRFAAHNYFLELRVSPFFLRVATVHPDLRPIIDRVVTRMTGRADCLVHGDFSPKNVLVGDRSLWVIDWETAHTGDPTFDLAFLVSHLACKAVHRPADRDRYETCARAFLRTYATESTLDVDEDDLFLQAGCLVLARVDGVSPVDYFDDDDRDRARALGRAALLVPERSLSLLFGR